MQTKLVLFHAVDLKILTYLLIWFNHFTYRVFAWKNEEFQIYLCELYAAEFEVLLLKQEVEKIVLCNIVNSFMNKIILL